MPRPIVARMLVPAERAEVLAYLARYARENLLLLDLVERYGAQPGAGELAPQLAVARRSGEIVGVAALRPSAVLDAQIQPETLAELATLFDPMGIGLVKSTQPSVDLLWFHLSRRRSRQAVVDRLETAYSLCADAARLAGAPRGASVRGASAGDLEDLVFAARESLREEGRPDPFYGDARSFRRWVQGRVPRARVVESGGRVVFVGYADVRRPQGWLLQGVYTWPRARRRGFAAAGTSALCREAFDVGAEHVQLSVVDGNDAARALYEGLGFKPFARLRTILFD
ncbi:MAG TPA: GNAT family N-acetyltransferase [Myxococcota bacterium]|nr:GNAT family N-acetyltransferase [Myxococcota bacterium]